MFDDDIDSAVQRSRKSSFTTSRNVLAMLVLAAVLTIHWRSSWLVNDPLWLDELHSVWVIDQGFSDVFPRAAAGNQSPLYFVLAWLVNLFVLLPGQAIRGISAVAGGGLLVLVGIAVWRWTLSKSAVLAAISVTAFSGSQLFYATEGRPYELLCLVGCVHVLLFLRWKVTLSEGTTSKTPTKRWKQSGLLAVLGVIAVLIHPLAILLVLAELAVVAIWWLAYRSLSFLSVIKLASCAFLPAMVMFAIMLGWLSHTVINRELWASVVSMDLTLTDMVRGLVVPAVVMVLGLVVDRSAIKRSDRGAINDLGALIVVVTFGVCVATWLGIAPLALPRYCMMVAAVPFLLTGLAIGSIQTKLARRIAATAVVASMFFLPLPTNLTDNRELATLSGFGWNGNSVSFAGWPLRNEPWEEVWKMVGPKGPVFILANILEDSRLEPGNRMAGVDQIHQAAGISIHEYLLFPTVDIGFQRWQLNSTIPVRTLHRPRFDLEDVRRGNWGSFIRVDDAYGDSWEERYKYWSGDWWFVVRASREIGDDAIEEFLCTKVGYHSETSDHHREDFFRKFDVDQDLNKN